MVVRTMRTAAANAAGLDGMVKLNSAEAFSGQPAPPPVIAAGPLT
jgi:hypothetical protein